MLFFMFRVIFFTFSLLDTAAFKTRAVALNGSKLTEMI